MARGRVDQLSSSGRYYRDNRETERERKQLERARLASAAYSFVEVHPVFADRWHPRLDPLTHVYRLTTSEDSDWRAFLREHGWRVGEKGRLTRLARAGRQGSTARPLTRQQEAASQRFHVEALGRSPESFRGIYNA